MASITFEIDIDKALADLAKELREFVPKRLPRAISRKVIPPLERSLDRQIDDKLRVYPPRRNEGSPPFVWSFDAEKNARARRWFHARYPNGYTRTGTLSRAWLGEITYKDNIITTRVENPEKAASYVYGGEPFDFVQVPGHSTTGWLNAGIEVPEVILDVAIELEIRLTDVIDEEIERL